MHGQCKLYRRVPACLLKNGWAQAKIWPWLSNLFQIFEWQPSREAKGSHENSQTIRVSGLATADLAWVPLPQPDARFCCTQSVSKVVLQKLIPQKSVNSSFTITNINDELPDLCGSRILQTDFENTLCEIRFLVEIHCEAQCVGGHFVETCLIPPRSRRSCRWSKWLACCRMDRRPHHTQTVYVRVRPSYWGTAHMYIHI